MQPFVSLNDREFLKDRRRSYRSLRMNAPVAVTEIDGEKAIVLSRYQDVDTVTKSPQTIVQPEAGHFPSNIGNGPSADFYKRSLPSIDHPQHSQLRRIISPVFLPQSIATMEQWVNEVRFEAPVHFRLRYVSAPMSIGDFNIDPGVRLLLGLASANWDETVFESPDSFMISRKPIRHFA